MLLFFFFSQPDATRGNLFNPFQPPYAKGETQEVTSRACQFEQPITTGRIHKEPISVAVVPPNPLHMRKSMRRDMRVKKVY